LCWVSASEGDAGECKLAPIAQSHTGDILKIETPSDGTAGHQEIYAAGLERNPDGLAFDIRGNL
jgi:hypothetical protein